MSASSGRSEQLRALGGGATDARRSRSRGWRRGRRAGSRPGPARSGTPRARSLADQGGSTVPAKKVPSSGARAPWSARATRRPRRVIARVRVLGGRGRRASRAARPSAPRRSGTPPGGSGAARAAPASRRRSISGSSSSRRSQQRVWNRHPDGGLAGDGTSPRRIIRLRVLSTRGSGIGTALTSATVYGCSGRS